ncbi:MAG TPA: T9SS type A sorting domain-containing protein [Bacteroidota bacterium]|nr:T9SS type A sorting domain-containing protein [Bacteroidota bacterium]
MKKSLLLLVPLAVLTMLSSMNAAQWVQTSGPKVTVQCFGVVGKNLFAGTFDGVFLTTNSGTTWTQVNTGLADTVVTSLAAIGSNLFASTYSGVFLTTNNGTSWKQMNSGLVDTFITKLAVVGTNLFAATASSGIYMSANNGTSWTSANGTVFQNAFIRLLSGTGTSLFAASSSNNIIYRSTDNGANWVPADSGLSTANAIIGSGSNFIAGGVTGVYLSTDNAKSWSQLTTDWGIQNTQPTGFVTGGSTVFGVSDAAIDIGAANGTNWTEITPPFTLQDPLNAVAIIDTNLFIGTNNDHAFTKDATVWSYSVKSIVTGVTNQAVNAPTDFVLNQNYPNPFNPSTTISFDLPVGSKVSLKIFNLLGQEVATLVSGEKEGGSYSVRWNASGMASGEYFYRLEAGGFTQVKKLMLLK